jgi:DNA-binding NarL/FixJ family response regulator
MGGDHITRAQHALAIVEAGYSLGGADNDWLARVLDAAGDDLQHGCGSYGFTCRIGESDLEMHAYCEKQLDPKFGPLVAEMNQTVPGAFFERLRRNAILCGGFDEIAPPVLRAHFRERGPKVDIHDSFFLVAQDGEGHAININAPARAKVKAHSRVRGVWNQVGAHLAAAMRLRRRFSEARAVRDAVLSPSGKIEHAEGVATSERAIRNLLSAAVKDAERARSKTGRRDPEKAMALWQGLVAGEWSLVDHWESDGKRYVATYRNRPDVPDPRVLTAQERLVFKYASLGESNKEIAFTLGLSVGAVGSAVSRLLLKLRCSRRTDLLAFADAGGAAHAELQIGNDDVGVLAVAHAPNAAAMKKLSATEREIAEMVVSGKTNAAIARARGTSTSTVANQMRAIFEKLDVGSRAELVRRLTRE